MYAQCPDCLTVYALDAATLAQARGSVRCGHCAAVFDALVTLSEMLPPEPFESLPAQPLQPDPPQLVMPVYRPPPQLHLPEASPAAVAPPAFARPHKPLKRARWIAGSTLLALLLAAQLGWAERDALMVDGATRPWLVALCRGLHCRLPLVQDLAALKLTSRDIRPHPSVPGALIISATLRNDAPFAQPFPVVDVSLSDLDENRVAMRRFRPSDYIRDAAVRARGLAPGASAALVFEVEDPGKNAVAFEFGFE